MAQAHGAAAFAAARCARGAEGSNGRKAICAWSGDFSTYTINSKKIRFLSKIVSHSMNILDANIGSAKDNMNSPVHNWYKFTAGFSYKFVDIILEDYHGQDITVYEPFAGCGTTLVECQKLGFRSVGNESQELMCGIINAKLNWTITQQQYTRAIHSIGEYVAANKDTAETAAKFHPLLQTLYDEPSLRPVAQRARGVLPPGIAVWRPVCGHRQRCHGAAL